MANAALIKLLVFRKMLLLTDGRDKILKIIQYSLKFLLWAYLKAGLIRTKYAGIASQLSLTRKLIRLGHWLEPIVTLVDLSTQSSKTSLSRNAQLLKSLAPLNAYVAILNDVADDIICLGKLNLLSSQWTGKASLISDRCWFFSIFIDMHELLSDYSTMTQKYYVSRKNREIPATSLPTSFSQESEMKALCQKIEMQRVSIAKLSCDFIFCSVDVFNLGDRVGDGVQAGAGLCAAMLGTYKIYAKAC